MYNPLRNQRGQALAALGIGLVAFAGLAALAVDIAHLAFVATEVQAAADAAATATAAAFRRSDGNSVGGNNSVSGELALISGCNDPACMVGSRVTSIDLGLWNSAANVFTPQSNPPYNAARATVTVSGVPNVLAGMFGQATSTVSKTAVAAVRPGLPLALGQGDICGFQLPPGSHEQKTIGLGELNFDLNAAWSTFEPDVPPSDVFAFSKMPQQCLGYGEPGGNQLMPVVGPDSVFLIRKAYFDQTMQALDYCVRNNIRATFVVPTFPCNAIWGSGSSVQVGLETITIISVNNVGNFNDASITIELSPNAALGEVALVQ
jgi:hypothetical protein